MGVQVQEEFFKMVCPELKQYSACRVMMGHFRGFPLKCWKGAVTEQEMSTGTSNFRITE